jgi:hypothetical protein
LSIIKHVSSQKIVAHDFQYDPRPICIPLRPNSFYMPCPSHPPSLDHSNYALRRVQVMKLLIMQFSPTSCHLISLQSKYSQHNGMEHPRVADGGDDLQIRRVAAHILNQQSRTADKGWSSSFGGWAWGSSP